MEKKQAITLCFDENSNKKIDEFISDNGGKNFCKVPYHTEDRIKNDTFPYHITLGSFELKNLEFLKANLSNLNFEEFELDFVPSVWDFSEETVSGKILYLKPMSDKKIKLLQKNIFEVCPSSKERFNPSKFNPHCTLHIDSDTKTIERFFENTKSAVLKLKIDSICLFENYPAKLLYKTNTF